MKELVFPTPHGPVVLRPRQVIKAEGIYFMIESVNEVRNGRQLRAYQLNEADALKYYVPTAPAVAAPTAGQVPAHVAQTVPETTPAAAAAPAAPATPPPAAAIPPPATPGQVPGAEAARPGEVPTEPAPEAAPPGEVPASMVPGTGNPEDGPKPIQGLTKEETQAGLADGRYTQDSEGNVFANPDAPSGDPRDTPNHIINPAAADNLTKEQIQDAQK